MGSFSFHKEERLCKRKQIQELFEKGSSFYLFPFKVVTLPQSMDDSPHQVLFSVSTRNFKRAVDRNLIKRRMREAYRKNKHKLASSRKLMLAFIYTAKEILPYAEIERKLILALGRSEKV
jgi:ribonuclease P protein component